MARVRTSLVGLVTVVTGCGGAKELVYDNDGISEPKCEVVANYERTNCCASDEGRAGCEIAAVEECVCKERPECCDAGWADECIAFLNENCSLDGEYSMCGFPFKVCYSFGWLGLRGAPCACDLSCGHNSDCGSR
jgi:hypothetical protein